MFSAHRRWLTAWGTLSLAKQFFITGAAVSLAAMLFVGALVANVIERSFIQHAASATALYVDSTIAPLLPDMQSAGAFDGVVAQALDETVVRGRLGQRLVSFRIWRPDGTILYAERPELVGQRHPISEGLRTALQGKVFGEYGIPDDPDSSRERAMGDPLLEIYSPVLQPWTGEVVAVLEFYERVPGFTQSLAAARWKGWAAVAVVTLGLFAALTAVVLRGSSTIESQRHDLQKRIVQLGNLAESNRQLAANVQAASERATAFNERFLRKLGADLHDGPAQLVAFASLRLGSRRLREPAAGQAEREKELGVITLSLSDAMEEIRGISAGLALPHLETAGLHETILSAVRAHEQRTKTTVSLALSDGDPVIPPDLKICIFRFLQEGLMNATRHAGGKGMTVTETCADGHLSVEIADAGGGFDVDAVSESRLGLAYMRQRVESVGGTMSVESSLEGTRVRMIIEIEGAREAEWAV